VVDYLRAVLLVQMDNISQVELAKETRAQAERYAKAFSAVDVLRMIKTFNIAATDLRGGWQPSLPLELALVEVMEFHTAIALADSRPAVKVPVETKVEKLAGKPAEKAAKPAEDTSNITLDQLRKAWKQIRAQIKPQNPTLDGLLNSCKLLEIKNGVLVIGFESELLRSKVDMPEPLEITRKAILDICGGVLLVKCVATNAKQATPPEVKADGMVAAAIKHGGEIVDIQE